jgi:glycerol-3-phosphate O-acyltransferase/dihydroxyacetone phosphate acyltransferase
MWSLVLFTLSLPGLILWLPVFITTFIAVHNFTKRGPIFDTYDEIAQYKLTYGLISGLCVWFSAIVIAWQYDATFIGVLSVPALMWMTLRWFEDAVSSFRALSSLLRLLYAGKVALKNMYERRQDLHSRVMGLAVETLGLPGDPEKYFMTAGGTEKGRVRGPWESSAQYFSIKRRRKRDWNETLRLYDKVDYPEDD